MNGFDKVTLLKPKTSTMNLSHTYRTTMDMGKLTPIAAIDLLPGDGGVIKTHAMIRFEALISPAFDEYECTIDYFEVPNRIMWAEWEDWFTQESDVSHPYFIPNNPANNQFSGSLADKLGWPSVPSDYADRENPFPIAAYYMIWDEYYRDSELQDEVFVPLIAGDNSSEDLYGQSFVNRLLNSNWSHDYFNSARPFAQKGPEVTIPLLQAGPATVTVASEKPNPFALPAFRTTENSWNDNPGVGTISIDENEGVFGNGAEAELMYNPGNSLVVDINAEASTIRTLRNAFALQRFQEIDARAGSRYIEKLYAHFYVKSSDSRVQRPRFLGRARQPISISEVLSTAFTDADNTAEVPVGYQAGHAISVSMGTSIRVDSEEHGWLIAIANVKPRRNNYMQGVPKRLSRMDYFDYAFPSFANIGEQEIKNKELYASSDSEVNAGTFGYQRRFAEYHSCYNLTTGDMRSSKSFWHSGDIYDSLPNLNGDFIECSPDDRIFAVTSESVDNINAFFKHEIYLNRRLPKNAIPRI